MSQEEFITNAMKAIGWNPSSDLPMANTENNKILQELEKMMEEKSKLIELQQLTEERADKLQQHLKNAEIGINHNLKLLSAYQEEMRTECHLLKLAERENSKIQEDRKNLHKDSDNLRKYVATTDKELCKVKHSVDNMTNRIQGAKTALIEWREAMDDSHKGFLLIEKYFKEDEMKARQQDQRRRLLQNEIDNKRKEVIRLTDEQLSLEQNLECTASLYRSGHAERRQMVETWKAAVSLMLQRENDIRHREQELIVMKRHAKEKTDEQKRSDTRLNNIIANNHDVEAAIEALNTETSDLKEKLQRIIDLIILKTNEVDLLQKELQNLTHRVHLQRLENRNKEKERVEKLRELTNFTHILTQLQERLEIMQNKNMSAQQRLQVLEDMNDSEQRTQKQITQETTRINGLIYRTQQQLVQFRSEEKMLEMNNDGLRVTAQAVAKNMRNIDKQLQRQIELNYNLGFKSLQIERRIATIQGGTLDPETEQRNLARLAELEALHAAALKRLQSVEAQNKKLDDNVNKVTCAFNDTNKELDLMQYKIKEAQSYCEGGIKRLRTETQNSQVLIVELSLLKMRAKEFETEIEKCENSSYNLEVHRVKLKRTIKDRIVEIMGQMDLLTVKRKHLNEERGTLRADIGERNKHIEAMRARFELTAQLLGANEDGTLVTATQLKVEAAQEKQLLLDEGNVLNEKVLRAENEIKAMENTLLLLNNSNDSYRRNFQKLDADEAEVELKNMQIIYCKSLNHLKALRNKLLHMGEEAEKSIEVKEELEKKLSVQSSKRAENEEVLKKVQKDMLDQKVKIQRAEREMKLALKSLRQSAIDSELIVLYERELDLRDLEYRNTKALNQLVDMADHDDNIGPKIIRLIQEKGLKLPHQLKKTHSFASWRTEVSEMSDSSSKDDLNSTSITSSDGTTLVTKPTSIASTRVSVVSIDFAVKSEKQ